MFTPIDRRVELMVDTISNFFSNYVNARANLVKLAAKLGGDERLARMILIRAGMRPYTDNNWYMGRFPATKSIDLLTHGDVLDALIADWAEAA